MAPCTVVVPTRNRPRQLLECLRSIAALDYPRERLEVVVVDDGGPTGATEVAREVDGLEIEVVETPHLGPAGARNAGARRAGGEILAFTDDDCRVDPGWLAALATALDPPGPVGAGGRTLNALPDDRWAAVSQQLIDLLYAYYNPGHGVEFLATNNLAVGAEAFREIGGFDERYRTAEDREFCRRWRGLGFELLYVPDAIVHHGHPLTLGAFARQHFEYGRGSFCFHRDAGEKRGLQARRSLGFYSSLPRLLRGLGPREAGQLTRLALSQAATGAGFGWEAARTALSPVARRTRTAAAQARRQRR